MGRRELAQFIHYEKTTIFFLNYPLCHFGFDKLKFGLVICTLIVSDLRNQGLSEKKIDSENQYFCRVTTWKNLRCHPPQKCLFRVNIKTDLKVDRNIPTQKLFKFQYGAGILVFQIQVV
jgi:hypothetical protein